MSNLGMRDLLEAGVHFGHQTRRWNPKMKRFVFMHRNGIHIIDLQKTLRAIATARKAIIETVSGGGRIVFVGTKRQAKTVVEEEAVRCNAFWVTERWLGGMLSIFSFFVSTTNISLGRTVISLMPVKVRDSRSRSLLRREASFLES